MGQSFCETDNLNLISNISASEFNVNIIDRNEVEYEIISSPITAGVSLFKTVPTELNVKIASSKVIELSTLLDPKHSDTVIIHLQQ